MISPVKFASTLRGADTAVLLLFLVVLASVGGNSFLIFHSFAELFSIVISFAVFFLAINVRRHTENSLLIGVAAGLGAAALLDAFHMFSYHGTGIFKDLEVQYPEIQFWLSARTLQAASFVFPVLFMRTSSPVLYPCLGYVGLLALALVLVFGGYFPVCYVPGSGLTAFKIVYEFILVGAFALGIWLIHGARDHLSNEARGYVMLALGSAILSELFFCFYASLYDWLNISGHLLKVVSVFFLYKGIIQVGLRAPFALMYRNLPSLREQNNIEFAELETKVGEYMRMLDAYQAALDESTMVVRYDAGGRPFYANGKLLQRLGASLESACAFLSRVRDEQLMLLAAGKTWRGEVEKATLSGESYFVFEVLVPLRINDRLESIFSFQTEITELMRHRQESQKLQRLATTGELTIKILHDAMNPVAIIDSALMIAEDKLASGNADLKRELESLHRGSDRLKDLFLSLRNNLMGVKPPPQVERTNLLESVEAARTFATQDQRYQRVEVSYRISVPGDLQVTLRRGQLVQVFLNLFINSLDVIQSRQERWIEVTLIARTPERVVLHVADCGEGIPAEVAAKIFDLLFTTKAGRGGTGLGLGIVRDILRASKGEIRLLADRAHTTFELTLPVA